MDPSELDDATEPAAPRLDLVADPPPPLRAVDDIERMDIDEHVSRDTVSDKSTVLSDRIENSAIQNCIDDNAKPNCIEDDCVKNNVQLTCYEKNTERNYLEIVTEDIDLEQSIENNVEKNEGVCDKKSIDEDYVDRTDTENCVENESQQNFNEKMIEENYIEEDISENYNEENNVNENGVKKNTEEVCTMEINEDYMVKNTDENCPEKNINEEYTGGHCTEKNTEENCPEKNIDEECVGEYTGGHCTEKNTEENCPEKNIDEECVEEYTGGHCTEKNTEENCPEKNIDEECVEKYTDGPCTEKNCDEQCIDKNTDEDCAEKNSDEQYIEKLTDEPCTKKNSDEQYIEKLTDEPCIEINSDEQCIEKLTDEPCTEINSDEQIIKKNIDEQCIKKNIDEQYIEKLTDESCTEINNDEQIIEKLTDEPCTEINSDEQYIEKLTDEPCTEINSDEQIIEKNIDEQCIKKNIDEQCIEKSIDAPCIEKNNDKACTEKNIDEQCIEKSIDAPCIEKNNDKACTEKNSDGQYIETLTDEPCIEINSDAPCIEKNNDKACTKKNSDEQYIEKLTDEPCTEINSDEQCIEKNIDVQCMEKNIDPCIKKNSDEQCIEKNIDVQCMEKNIDPCIKKNSDEQCIEKSIDAPCIEKNSDEQYIEKNIDKSCIEKYSDERRTEKNSDEQYFEKSVDAPCIEENTDEPCIEKSSDEQCLEKNIDGEYIEKNVEENCIELNTDENYVDKNFEDSYTEKTLEECSDEKSGNDFTEKDVQENSQVNDPFDDLLASKNELADTQEFQDNSVSNNDEDIDNLLDDDQDHVTDDVMCENASIADISETQGADEEVCLLPDTEREISEADKLKALVGKKCVDDTINAYDSVKNQGNIEDMKDEDMNEINEDLHDDVMDDADNAIDHTGDEDVDEEGTKDLHEGEKENEESETNIEESVGAGIIQEMSKIDQKCYICSENKECSFRALVENEVKYFCNNNCIKKFQENSTEKYDITYKKVIVSEILPVLNACFNCEEKKMCFYRYTYENEAKYLCHEQCLQSIISENIQKYRIRRKKKFVNEVSELESTCYVCLETKKCIYETNIEGDCKHICNIDCFSKLHDTQPNIFKLRKKKILKSKQSLLKLKVISNATDKYLDEGNKIVAKTPEQVAAARADRDKSFFRKCAQCQEPYVGYDKSLSWETMDFCNEICLGKYQNTYGLHCANCKNAVSMVSLGKYCVRFGYDIRQFCCSGCLDEFKKGLKICCYCQRDISTGHEGFLAPVGDQGQFKDFCSQYCVEKFDEMSKNPIPPPVWAQCAVCSKEKPTQLEVAVDEKKSLRLCSEPCFAAFKFVNHVFPDQCHWCKKYFERKSSESYTIYTDTVPYCFCSKTCMNVYISNSRHIVPCNWCKVKKYNFDMIKKILDNGQPMMMCSLNCLTLYQVSVNAVSSRRIKCDQCKRFSQAQYHLTMSDATVRNFCTYQCVMSFQRQYNKSPMLLDGDSHTKQAVPTGAPRRTYNNQKNNNVKNLQKKASGRPSGMPVISSVKSLATSPISQQSGHATRAKAKRMIDDTSTPSPVEPVKAPTPPPPPPPQIHNHVVIKPPPPKIVKNISTMTKPLAISKGVSCRTHTCTKEIQTDDHLQRRILVPIPVPIYVPAPMVMYSTPFPVPVPIPLPIPIPVFIPTTRNSANGIMKEIKKIHDKMPTDPFEAELLMMAEMVAGDKKKSESDSESDEENGDDGFSPDGMDTGNSAFGEDVLQMALKMASEYDEPPVDLESAMTANTITPSSHPTISGLDENNPMHHHQLMLLEQQRAAAAAVVGRKRSAQGGTSPVHANTRQSKRRRAQESQPQSHHAPPEPPREPQEKPDAHMCLKYTFGVNAWKQWVMTKNAEMEKSTMRRKPFKSEILQLTADELNYSLCLFVKEVRKPNGSEYAPDTIYYLVLGIQQYLFENGRIDNIFTDSYYEKFTDCLDEVARKFSILYNDSQYIVTRVEEEHLWESKQLGAHSPHVLLSTLMFFNTKHFNLVTVEEHMQLSFSHIMKHWKRNPNQPGATKIPGARNVLLRFYPPQSALDSNSRKKKVYEQQENEENPLRCPVKLYEFYISKCPESVKTRNDVFYLMPERSCVPDSPVWYSTQALGREPLSKMLHRVKMVKEINIALLTS